MITGGAGFIGSNRLLCHGRSVVIFDDLSHPGVERNLDWLRARHGRSHLHVEIADIRDYAALEPGREILIADSGDAVANLVAVLSVEYARKLGQNAFSRIRAEHTYAHRAAHVEALLTGSAAAPVLGTYA